MPTPAEFKSFLEQVPGLISMIISMIILIIISIVIIIISIVMSIVSLSLLLLLFLLLLLPLLILILLLFIAMDSWLTGGSLECQHSCLQCWARSSWVSETGTIK